MRGGDHHKQEWPWPDTVKLENPLLRSGIALAGANHGLESGEGDRRDGLLTAEEALGLRLRGTDMVVLCACNTGAGEVKSGEGVYGLRRAFTQAGTKSLEMSMWSVPDQETKEPMAEFYRNIVEGRMSRCQALRHAELEQMQIVKERYGHTNPFYWGAFVFMGET
jgi:CHAT domain-containing protein